MRARDRRQAGKRRSRSTAAGSNRSLRRPSDQLFLRYDSRRIVQIDDLFFLNEIMFDPVRGEGREVLGSMAGGVSPVMVVVGSPRAAGSLASDVQADPARHSPQGDHVGGPRPIDDGDDVAGDSGHSESGVKPFSEL